MVKQTAKELELSKEINQYIKGIEAQERRIKALKNIIADYQNYKQGFEILNCYFDSISGEEQIKVNKQLTKLGL